MIVKVNKLSTKAKIPTYATHGAACFDVYAVNTEAITVSKDCPAIIGTGLAFEIPQDYVMLVYTRSGHAFKNDIRLANCVGVIDSDFRGELKIKLSADGEAYVVQPGERIAQAMVLACPSVNFEEVESLSDTNRGTGGFGSSDK